jgi:hypothetical protein
MERQRFIAKNNASMLQGSLKTGLASLKHTSLISGCLTPPKPIQQSSTKHFQTASPHRGSLKSKMEQ